MLDVWLYHKGQMSYWKGYVNYPPLQQPLLLLLRLLLRQLQVESAGFFREYFLRKKGAEAEAEAGAEAEAEAEAEAGAEAEAEEAGAEAEEAGAEAEETK